MYAKSKSALRQRSRDEFNLTAISEAKVDCYLENNTRRIFFSVDFFAALHGGKIRRICWRMFNLRMTFFVPQPQKVALYRVGWIE